MHMTFAAARALAFLFLLALVGCSQDFLQANSSTDPEFARLEKRAMRVEIVRDDFGVPHIYGKTDADAVFGMLSLYARKLVVKAATGLFDEPFTSHSAP